MNIMKKSLKVLTLCLTLIALTSIVFSTNPSDLLWNGFLQVNLDKPQFDLNENISGSIYINNLESYPIVDGRIVIQIADGNYSYPSQFSQDNIVFEETINDIWALPTSMKKIDFNIINNNLAGNYRLDIYMWVVKSQFIGSSSILYNPLSTNFLVKGKNDNKAIIIRDKTEFSNTIGPVGFPVKANDNFSGKVVIKNTSNYKKENLSLEVSICDWAVSFCNDLNKKNIQIPSLNALEEKEILVSLIAPSIPSAYEINLVLKDNKNNIESIYKSRVIVTGATSKVRKVFITGLNLEDYSITSIIAGSPDHFTNPTLENFKLINEIYLNNILIEENFIDINSIAPGEIIIKQLKTNKKSFDKVCIVIKKETNELEKECFSIPLSELIKAQKELENLPVKVNWKYDEANSKLQINLEKELINAKIILLNNETTIFESIVTEKLKQYTEEVNIEKNNLTLIIDDFDSKKQQVFELTFNNLNDLRNVALINSIDINGNLITSSCKEQICKDNYVCSTQTIATIDGPCCKSECVKQKESSNELFVPLILISALILLIIAIFVLYNTLRKVKK